jgi:hypothetical protein
VLVRVSVQVPVGLHYWEFQWSRWELPVVGGIQLGGIPVGFPVEEPVGFLWD